MGKKDILHRRANYNKLSNCVYIYIYSVKNYLMLKYRYNIVKEVLACN